MRICITVNAAWNVWNFRRPLVRALIDAGHSVHVLAPYDETVEDLLAMGCAFTHLPMSRKGLNPLLEMALLVRFCRTFQRLRPDAVLSFTVKNNIFGSLASALFSIPFVPNVTGLGTAFLSEGVLQRVSIMLQRLAFRRCPVVFFQNEDDRDLFVESRIVTVHQARVLPGSGIDLEAFMPVAAAGRPEPLFLFVGRLLRDKGVIELAEAARIVRTARPDVTVQILGAFDHANRSAISRAEVDEWVRQGSIVYLGQADDVRPHVAKADCVVLPSYREGAPRTLIEAAAMARPAIATDVPGCRAVVENELTGLLCAVRDANSLAKAMLRFCDFDSEERAAMGDAARRKMEQEFSADLITEEYMNSLSKLVSKR